MKNIQVLLNEDEIIKRTKELSKEIKSTYKDEEVIFVSTLKGSIIFASELFKNYEGDAKIEFIRVSSYSGKESSKSVKMIVPLDEEKVKNKNILIVEDIVDSGYTLEYLYNYFNSLNVLSVRCVSLLNKECKRKVKVDPTWYGFKIDDLFVVGYGLDYDELYRNLPFVGVLK